MSSRLSRWWIGLFNKLVLDKILLFIYTYWFVEVCPNGDLCYTNNGICTATGCKCLSNVINGPACSQSNFVREREKKMSRICFIKKPVERQVWFVIMEEHVRMENIVNVCMAGLEWLVMVVRDNRWNEI